MTNLPGSPKPPNCSCIYENQGVREYLLEYPEEKKVTQFVLPAGIHQKRGPFLMGDQMALKVLDLDLVDEDIFESIH